MSDTQLLLMMYRRLTEEFGPTGWWPAQTPFEVAVGAVLTQNTTWRNVEKAIKNLKEHRLLSARALSRVPLSKLAQHVRPAGYYRLKSQRLKNFVDFLQHEYAGSMARMAREPTEPLREKLLGVTGIGPETADSILLYALGKPVFVVDAYTRRILSRHGMVEQEVNYEELQRFFEEHLPRDVPLFKEFHALLVRTGAQFCKREPRCNECPLNFITASDGSAWTADRMKG
jgi:endonuclease-3 related protein